MNRDSTRLVNEAEAFLGGHARDTYQGARLPIPGWAELNWLAHAETEAVLARVRSEACLDESRQGSWEWAVDVLASTLVEAAGGSQSIVARVQRDCIIPMELALLAAGCRFCLPTHLVALGVPRIRHCTWAIWRFG